MHRPRWFVQSVIILFARLYRIDLAAVGAPVASFSSLLSFFLRQPRAGSRPVDAEALSVVSPVDALVTACGTATADSILLVKGHPASLRELVGDPLPEFDGGAFVMLYLSPADIHRIYAPFDATVAKSWRIEGSLYPVGPRYVAKRPRTFVINRRVLTELATPHGKIMMVNVGARNVGRIITHHPVPCGAAQAHTYRKGAEVGWFELGSTVILLFERDKFTLDLRVVDGARVMIGQAIGRAVQS